MQPNNDSESSSPNQPQQQGQPQPSQPEHGQHIIGQPGNALAQQALTGQPHIMYMTRPADPPKQHISEASKQKHDESKKKYPHLNLSEGEFIISALARHPIGLIGIWGAAIFVTLLMIGLLYLMRGDAFSMAMGGTSGGPSLGLLLIPFFLVLMLVIIFAGIATYVYNANRFYLTNESVIQHIQTSLFSKHEQTVSLINVEDASFTQNGIIQHLLDYGTIRLSTEGEETTYRYGFAPHPKKDIAVLNNAVEAFKNGRPVTGDDVRSDD